MTATGLLAIEKHKDAFEYVVTTAVLGLPTDNDIWKAFVYNMGSEDLLNVYRLIGMATNDVAELDFKPNDQAKNAVPLPKGSDPMSSFSRQCTKNTRRRVIDPRDDSHTQNQQI